MHNPMTAREAWEIVLIGPAGERYHFERGALAREAARYARACAIVEACVEYCEAESAYRAKYSDENCDRAVAAADKLRALERGEEGK